MTRSAPAQRLTGSRAVIGICFAILMCEGFDLAMFGSIVPSLRDYADWSLSPAMIGYMGSATVLGMLFGALSAAGFADRVGRRPVVIAAVTVFSAAMGICAIAPSPEIFLAARFVVGLGAGAVMPTIAATLIEFSPADKRSTTTALGFIGVGVGGVLAGALSLWLVPAYGFRAMCVVGFLPLVLIVPFMVKYLPESVAILHAKGRHTEAEAVAARHGLPLQPVRAEVAPADVSGDPASSENRLKAVFGEGRGMGSVLFWAGTFFCLLLTFGVSAWLPDLLEGAGYSLSVALGSLIALKAGSVVGVLAAAWLADRFGQKKVVVGTYLAGAASLAVLASQPPVWIAYALIAVLGLGTTGLQILLNAYVGTYYPARVRATGLGLNLSIGRVGGIVGPTYLGFLVAAGLGFDAKFYALAAPALVGAFFIACIPKRGSASVGASTNPSVRAKAAA